MEISAVGSFPVSGGANAAGAQRELAAACKEFEAIFLRMLMRSMRETVPKEGIVPRTTALETFEGMLDAEYARVGAASGGFGIADMLYEYLLPAVSEKGGQ